MTHLDPTNPFAGGLPAPIYTPSPPAPEPHLDPNNPFFNPNEPNENDEPEESLNNATEITPNHNHETPGETDPFFKEQQAAIERFQKQQALEEKLAEQNDEYLQKEHVLKEELNQMEQQLNQQQSTYYNQQLVQQHQMMQYMQQSMQLQQAYAHSVTPRDPFFNPAMKQAQEAVPPPPPITEAVASNVEQEASSAPKTDEKEEKQSPEELKEGKRKRNRVRAVNELIETERTYITKLELLNDLYIKPMKKNEKLLKNKFHPIIFPQILQTILFLNQKLLKTMELNKLQIGKSMIDFIPYLKMYQNYMNNHEAASRLMRKLRADKNSEFCKYIATKEREQNGFTLESYLILPIQRMPRYELCLREIIKLTLDEHEDIANLKKCFESISVVNKQINMSMKDYETRQRVYEIEERIMNLEINKNRDKSRKSGKLQKSKSSFLFNNKRNSKSALSVIEDVAKKKEQISRTRLVQPSRVFIKQGHLSKVSRKKDIRYLFILFNDLLIYCSETMSDKLLLHQRIDLTDEFFRIEGAVVLSDESDQKQDKKQHNHNTFEIHSIEKSFLCYAQNNKDREEWIDAIEKCVANIKKWGISKSTLSKQHSERRDASMMRMDSMPLSIAAGSSRFNSSMIAVTAPSIAKAVTTLSIVDVLEDEGRILETAPMFVPNDWADSCMMILCNNTFNSLLLKRRNHCRYCGKLVCDTCCSNTLPHYEPKKRKAGVYVKVCTFCFDKYKVKPLINVEEMKKVSDDIHGSSASKEPSLKIEEKSLSTYSSSDLFEELYELHTTQTGNETPGAPSTPNAALSIPQSLSPLVSNGTNAFAVDPFNLNLNLNPSKAMHTQHMSYVNYNNANHQIMGNRNSMPPFSMSGAANNSLSIDGFDAPLPAEIRSNTSKEDLSKIHYDADMGTVNAIIAANDNLINSMDLSAFHGDKEGKEKEDSECNAVILDENAEAHDSESSIDDFASNFENIVIPDSVRADANEKDKNELFSFLDSPQNNKNPKKAAVEINVMDLDKKHENVKQLALFGFNEENIEDAWELMKENKAHKHIVPDHGPLFVETMLDYLNKVQKEQSKASIMDKYKDVNDNNHKSVQNSTNYNNNNNNQLLFNFEF